MVLRDDDVGEVAGTVGSGGGESIEVDVPLEFGEKFNNKFGNLSIAFCSRDTGSKEGSEVVAAWF